MLRQPFPAACNFGPQGVSLRSIGLHGRCINNLPGSGLRLQVKLKAANVQTERDSTLDYFGWAASKGIQGPKLKLAVFDGVRGVEAIEDIAEGEVVVSVPRNMALVVTPKMRCPFPDFLDSNYWNSCPWFVKMALLVLQERRKGEQSSVVGYMEHIPSSFPMMPIHWSPQELQELQYSYILHQVEDQRKKWRGYFMELQGAVQKPHSVTYDEFHWSLEAVRSRCFSGPYSGSPLKARLILGLPLALGAALYVSTSHIPLDQALNGAIAAVLFNILYDLFLSARLRWYAMCPVVDSMNHKGTVKNEVAYEYFRDSFSVTAQNPVGKSDQVFISYGGQSNDSLLHYYGFIEADTPYDTYEIMGLMDHLAAQRTLPADRVATLAAHEEFKDFNAKATAKRDGFDGLVLQCVRYLISQRDAPLSTFKSQGSNEEEHAVLSVLGDIAEAELQQLGTTLQEDMKMLEKGGQLMSSRKKMAVEFRAAKKRVLTGCLINTRKKILKLAT